MLVKSDPIGAVDIYCRFPVAEDPTFDDAFIFQEIVRLLIKNEKFDDQRLEKNMIRLGRVMGLGKFINKLILIINVDKSLCYFVLHLFRNIFYHFSFIGEVCENIGG